MLFAEVGPHAGSSQTGNALHRHCGQLTQSEGPMPGLRPLAGLGSRLARRVDRPAWTPVDRRVESVFAFAPRGRGSRGNHRGSGASPIRRMTGSRRSDGGMVGRIDSPSATFDLVIAQGSVDALPEVAILDGDHRPERLPPPSVLPPLGQTKSDPLSNVGAARDEGNACGLIQGFQSANHGQQLQSFPPDVRFDVFHHQALRPVACPEHETPLPRLFGVTCVGEEEIVRPKGAHREIPNPSRRAWLDARTRSFGRPPYHQIRIRSHDVRPSWLPAIGLRPIA